MNALTICNCYTTSRTDEPMTDNYRPIKVQDGSPHLQYWALKNCPACHGTGERPRPAKVESLPGFQVVSGLGPECPRCHRARLSVLSDGSARCFGCGNAERLEVPEPVPEPEVEAEPSPQPIRRGRYRGRWGAEHEVSPVAGNPDAVLVGVIDTGTLMSTGKFNQLVSEGKLTPIEEGPEPLPSPAAEPEPIRWGRYRDETTKEVLDIVVRILPDGERRVSRVKGGKDFGICGPNTFRRLCRIGRYTYLGPVDEPEPESPQPPTPPIGVRLLTDQLAEARGRIAVYVANLEKMDAIAAEVGIDHVTVVSSVRAMADELIGLRGQIRDALTALKQTEVPSG